MSGKGLIVGVAFALTLVSSAFAQTDVAALRDQTKATFDVVSLSGGVALVPKKPIAGVRLIEVRQGAVTLNGQPVTASDLKTKLGKDADVVLRVTYLDAAGLATLTGAAAAGAAGGANVAPAPPAPPTPPTPPADDDDRPGRRHGKRNGGKDDIIRFGGSVTVEKDDHVAGDVVVFGGSADILGTVDGELVVIGGSADVQGTIEGDVSVVGGSLDLGPTSVVKGDVSVAGGSLHREDGSRIDGKLEDVGVGRGKRRHTITLDSKDLKPNMGFFARTGSFFGTLWRGVLLLLLTFAMIALAGRYVRPIAARAGAEPVRSGLTGLLAEVLFVPVLVLTIVVLAVSIIGIPFLLLLPFALVLVALASLGGFAGVAVRMGRSLAARFGVTSESPYVHATLGVVGAMALTLIGRALWTLGEGFLGHFMGGLLIGLGVLVEYLVWTVGLGAAIWVLRQNRGRAPREDGPSTPESPVSPISPISPIGHDAPDAGSPMDYRALPPAGPETLS